MQYSFETPIVEWRGPAPFYFAVTPDEVSQDITSMAGSLSYGWGCIPVDVTIGDTTFYTALIPREGAYFVPLKVAVRKAAGLGTDGVVALSVKLRGA